MKFALLVLLWISAAAAASNPLPPYLSSGIKADFGHYFATRYADTPADAAMLCAKPGVTGVVWRQTWGEVETNPGVYDWRSFDAVVSAVRPGCRVWIFIEWKSFAASPVKNPCPAYLRSAFSALNADGNGAATCFMWEPAVLQAYKRLLAAAGARYDARDQVEGVILQESATGFNGTYSQDAGGVNLGTYTAEKYRDALIDLSRSCSASFKRSRCMQFLNFIRNGPGYLRDVAAAIDAIPNRQACVSGPDILPGNKSLEGGIYPVIRAHKGCRANSAQNDSFEVAGCALDCIMDYATGNLCVNSYLFWNHRVGVSATGLDWTDALPVIASRPFSQAWLACGGAAP